MQVTDWISAILVGIVIGVLGRLVLPGRQRIGVFVTVLIGVGAALLGGFIANSLDLTAKATTRLLEIDFHWWQLAIQVAIAVLGTAFAAMIAHSRVAQNDPPAKKRARARKS
jgi:uncharacterized membrane protein YeaQ/YmgE (transglycosylase-associated protein family)